MKKYIATLLCLVGIVNATEKTIMGPGKFSGETITTPLKVMGPITANKLTAKDIEGFGPATFTNKSTVGSIEIHGPLTAQDSTFNGWAQVYGPVTAESSTFNDDITVKGHDVLVKLTDTKTKNITINIAKSGVTKKSGGFSFLYTTEKPKGTRVVLKGNTIVDGSIRFRGGEGVVIKDETAQITGTVFGAKKEENDETDK